MRTAPVSRRGCPAVILVAHGSRDPRAAAATTALSRAVQLAQPDWDVSASYLDHAGPRPLEVLGSLGRRRAVLVPLLLTAAYHGRVDVPAVLEAARPLPVEVSLADVLGPVSALLLDALVRRLGDAARSDAGLGGSGLGGFGLGDASLGGAGVGGVGLDAVVLAAAGTRDAAARETVAEAAEALGVRLGVPAAVAYASAAPPTAGAAVERLRAAGARRVAMSSYFLAPGRLHDVAVASALEAGAIAIAPPLTDAPELVRLVTARVEASLGADLIAA